MKNQIKGERQHDDASLDRHSTVGGLVAVRAELFLSRQPAGLGWPRWLPPWCCLVGQKRDRHHLPERPDQPSVGARCCAQMVHVPFLTPIAIILLLLPAVWFAPWPYRAAPLLIVSGWGCWRSRHSGQKRGQVQFVRSTLRAVPANCACPLFDLVLRTGTRRRGGRRGAVRPSVGAGVVRQPHRAVARVALAAARPAGRHRRAAGHRRRGRRLESS